MATGVKEDKSKRPERHNKKPPPKPGEVLKDGGVDGRATKYRPEYDQQGYKLALLGYSFKDMALFWDVTELTLDRWRNSYPSFQKAIREGRVPADMEVAQSLYKQAIGYNYNTQEAVRLAAGEGTQRVEVVTVSKFSPPSFFATSRWLANRQRALWPEKGAAAGGTEEDVARSAQEAIAAADKVSGEGE